MSNNSEGPYVIGIKVSDGQVAPLAWSNTKLSIKQLKNVVKKFKNDSDFRSPAQMSLERLYNTKQEMKSQLPKL